MKHLDLFSGIGGFALAAKWAGIETVAFCEIDNACLKVLNKHWPGIVKHQDIKNLDGHQYAEIDIITGGYPCQPFSVAGNQKAKEDHRNLWPEMLRIITQAQPTWIICENVYGYVALGLDDMLYDLEAINYTAQPFIIPSLSTGRNHNRERVFIVAYTASNGRDESTATRGNEKTNGNSQKRTKKNSNHEGCSSIRPEMDRQSDKAGRRGTKPPTLRVDDELPRRMDRNRMLGNAVDPMIVYQILSCVIKQHQNLI